MLCNRSLFKLILREMNKKWADVACYQQQGYQSIHKQHPCGQTMPLKYAHAHYRANAKKLGQPQPPCLLRPCDSINSHTKLKLTERFLGTVIWSTKNCYHNFTVSTVFDVNPYHENTVERGRRVAGPLVFMHGWTKTLEWNHNSLQCVQYQWTFAKI